ncbi:helix-turn-helix domain-containing protein [Macrococcoides canis]|nr:helix-turn-helix domain-containing protein [Macrococcus canis]
MRRGNAVFANNLKRLRESRGLTYRELADELNKKYDAKFSKSTIQRWEETESYPSIKHAAALSHYFDVTLDELSSSEKENNTGFIKEKDAEYITSVIELPVLSKISAGLPIYTEENIIDYVHVSKEMLKAGKKHFGLLVDGDSMDKEFRNGDVVIIEKDSIIENGQIGVVMVNGYNATLKRVRYNGDMVILQPESNNPEHQPQFYNINDEIRFIGRVVGMHRKY